ncbi:MAG: DUF433 domain-containing protein [Bacteroidota bacterium]
MTWKDYIDSDQKVLAGKPKIKGTRLSVEFLIGRMADGWTEEEILENYPHLTKEALQAVYLYLLEIIQDGIIYAPMTKEAA